MNPPVRVRVRRKYKVDVNKRRKLLPGEIEHVEDMAIVLALAGYSRTQTGQMIGTLTSLLPGGEGQRGCGWR